MLFGVLLPRLSDRQEFAGGKFEADWDALSSDQNVSDDVAFDVGQAEVPAVVAPGQLFVVQSQ